MKKFRITIEQLDDKMQPDKRVPKTSITCAGAETEWVEPHQVRFNAVMDGLTNLIKHESLKYANGERSIALESVDEVLANTGDEEDVGE